MNVPLVVGGIAVTAVGTAVLISGLSSAVEASDASGDSEGASDGVVIAGGGVTLAAGVGMLLWGTIGGPRTLVPNRQVSFMPQLGPREAGGNLTITF